VIEGIMDLYQILGILLAFAALMVGLWKAIQFSNKNKSERLSKEMDLLIAPIYSKIGNINIFLKGAPTYQNNPKGREYFEFWDNVKKYKHLGSESVISAIDDYLKNKINTVGDRNEDENYAMAKEQLYKVVTERYNELAELLQTI